MTKKHWIAVGLFLTGVASLVAGVDGWQECIEPSFVAGVILNAGSVIVAAASDKLGSTNGGIK
jgi:hypothetical protein